MPRKPRIKSETGIYHVMLRGINKQRIFEDKQDYQKFLNILKETKEISDYDLYSYCLMSNHIHLLIKETEVELGEIFKRFGAKFVYWYNYKYSRTGHLFQGRFKSEVVETDSYLLTVLRYIHQNPRKANLVKSISNYPWSSYNEYIGNKNICDTQFILEIFSKNKSEALSEFVKFNNQTNNDLCLDLRENNRVNDSEAEEIIKKISKFKSPTFIQNVNDIERDKIIKKCKNNGLSIRQIQRLTGISFAIIRKI
jgi:REP element-mobilizing transposase RayT